MIGKTFLFAVLLLLSSIFCSAQFKLYEKGHDYYSAGKYNDAITSFTEFLSKPTRDKSLDAEVHYLVALSYFKTNVFDHAVSEFEEALLSNHPNAGNINWFKAKCHEKLLQNNEAIQSYTNAIRLLDSDKTAKSKLYYERGMLYSKTGDASKARADFQAGLAAVPNQADLTRELAKIEKQPGANTQGKTTEPVQTADTKKTDLASTTPNNAQNNNPTGSNSTGTEKKSIFKKKGTDGNAAVPTAVVLGKDNNSSKTDQAVTQPVDTKPAQPTLADMYADEKRYALVIGNSSYPKAIGVLKNPVNDATDFAKELQNSNFDVQLLTNATYGQMRAAMLKFKEKIDAGDRDKTVSLFYFAGHGLQHDDENYLVPVDAMIEYEDDIARYCFGTQKMVLANMERSNSRMNIVILDACRNNPFPALTRSTGQQGLGEMRRARGSFIAYATAPGSVASDGSGRNGLYTQELLKAMKKPGLTIEQVFKEVRANVLRLSGDKQNTWDSSNIVGEFYFKFQ